MRQYSFGGGRGRHDVTLVVPQLADLVLKYTIKIFKSGAFSPCSACTNKRQVYFISLDVLPCSLGHPTPWAIPPPITGMLCTLTRMFSLAVDEMQARLKTRAFENIGVALAEGVAAVDRIGNYCLTGSSKALVGSVLRPLGIIDGIHFGAWAYINPKLLSLHRAAEGVDLSGWPRGNDGRPLLMHSTSLQFHY